MANKLLYRISEIEPRATSWDIPGLIEHASFGAIFGPSGTAKSLWAQALSVSMATGRDFFGYTPKTTGTVVYIAGEGHSGIRRRFRALEMEWDVFLGDAPIYVSARAVPFGDPEALKLVIPEIDAVVEKDGKVALIVVDTLSRNLSGDENSPIDMPAFVRALDDLKARYKATNLVVHHSGHSAKERSRGHSSFKAALDFEFRTEFDLETGVVRVESTKTKDHRPPKPQAFRLKPVNLDVVDEDGWPVESVVLEQTDYEAPRKQRERKGKHKTVILDVLHQELGRYRGAREAAGMDPEPARVELAEWRRICTEDKDVPRQRFSENLKALQDSKDIVVDNGFAYLATSPPFHYSGPDLSGSLSCPVSSKEENRTDRTNPDSKTGHKPDNKPDKPDSDDKTKEQGAEIEIY